MYVEIVDGARGLRSLARVGGRHPAHSTAVGKAMLAHMDDVSRSASLPRVLRRRTGRTHVDARRLADELAAVAAAGHAIEVGENEEGAACVGVPVIGLRGEVSGALSIAVPSARLARAHARDGPCAGRERGRGGPRARGRPVSAGSPRSHRAKRVPIAAGCRLR